MQVKGVRILDTVNRVVSVELSDILVEISNGNSFHWSILLLDAMGDLGKDKPIPEFQKQIKNSERGYFIDWIELNILSQKFYQIIDMILIGCKDKNLLKRYKTEQEMYETCDFVIDMFDSSYWKVFSKDEKFIESLKKKFKKTEDIEFS